MAARCHVSIGTIFHAIRNIIIAKYRKKEQRIVYIHLSSKSDDLELGVCAVDYAIEDIKIM